MLAIGGEHRPGRGREAASRRLLAARPQLLDQGLRTRGMQLTFTLLLIRNGLIRVPLQV